MESLSRPRLIPLWAIIVPAAVLLVGIGVIVAYVFLRQASFVSVPNVTGLDVSVARARLAEQGLRLARGDKRFSSSVPVDGVIDQSPLPGAKAKKGTTVTVVVSVGSESFPLPDVTGLPLQSARDALQAKGLVVQVEVVPSQKDKNTVLASSPAPGLTVGASDVVKLKVSSGAKGSIAGLQPTDLTGKVFVIDPAPVSGATTDTPMEVQRRLNSLLEASGAQVVVTRSVTYSGLTLTPDARSSRSRAASATAIIGLDVAPSGAGGLRVQTMQSLKVPSEAYLGSAQLSQALVKSLSSSSRSVAATEVASDRVLEGPTPAARVILGSAADKADTQRFADPAWEDQTAQAIYMAIGSVFGTKK